MHQLDKTKDITPRYRTSVFDVVTWGKNNQPIWILDQLQCSMNEEGPGLFTLFTAPRNRQCNRQTFEDAADEGKGFYYIYIELSRN